MNVIDNDIKDIRRKEITYMNKRKGDFSGTRIVIKRKKRCNVDDEWKWWKENEYCTRAKWNFLEHNGPFFTPEYKRLPEDVNFYYDGTVVRLCDQSQEVAGFYARLLGHEYTRKPIFNQNFMDDWRKFMNESERALIVDLNKCNFTEIYQHYQTISEARKNLSKEAKHTLNDANRNISSKYEFCIVDGYKQKIENYKIEPPGLFRGRGDHPKMGCVKRRIHPEDVTINCSQDSQIPKPPSGHQWKEVRHDPSVCWLASWMDDIQQNWKYILLNVSSRIRGERDLNKYEIARKLHMCIDEIRNGYLKDMQSKEMIIRQRAVALYFIDKLALRAGNEKWDDEADTVGCCSLRVEHVRLQEEVIDKSVIYEVELDFLGKDSVRYNNCFPVLKRVYKNVARFIEDKQPCDNLFDRLNTSILNQYLKELMDGLTAKVFRTYNASRTLEEQLELYTNKMDSVEEKVLAYNRANRAVAILCNHQKSISKGFEKSMEKLSIKIKEKKVKIKKIKIEAQKIKKQYKKCKDTLKKNYYEKLGQKLLLLQTQLNNLENNVKDRTESKDVALGTSKLNYLDPRISVAWCLNNEVPIEKIYNKSQLQKFRWAVDIASCNFVFCDLDSDSESRRWSRSESYTDSEDTDDL